MEVPENTRHENPMGLKVIRKKLSGPKDLMAFASNMSNLRKVCIDSNVHTILLVSEMEPLGAYDVFNYCIVLKENFPAHTIIWVETKADGSEVQRFIKHVFESGAYLKGKIFSKETDAIHWLQDIAKLDKISIDEVNRSLIVIN